MEAELIERITRFNTEKEDLRNDVESYCSDTNIDLETRWNLFIESKLGKHSNSLVDFEDLGVSMREEIGRLERIDLISKVQEYEAKLDGIIMCEIKERILDKFVKSCGFYQ